MSETKTPTGFDADQRAKAREDEPITIGAQTFHQRRKNWDTTVELRRLLRARDRTAMQRDKAIDELSDYDGDDETRLTELEAAEEEAIVAAELAIYNLIAQMIHPAGAPDGRGDVEHLKQHLHIQEAGDLSALLITGASPDPTPTPPSSET